MWEQRAPAEDCERLRGRRHPRTAEGGERGWRGAPPAAGIRSSGLTLCSPASACVCWRAAPHPPLGDALAGVHAVAVPGSPTFVVTPARPPSPAGSSRVRLLVGWICRNPTQRPPARPHPSPELTDSAPSPLPPVTKAQVPPRCPCPVLSAENPSIHGSLPPCVLGVPCRKRQPCPPPAGSVLTTPHHTGSVLASCGLAVSPPLCFNDGPQLPISP